MLGYWRVPWNWLEVSIIVTALMYSGHHACLTSRTLEVTSLLLGRDRKHVDLRTLSCWEQQSRSLQGLLLLFLTMKSMLVFRRTRVMMTPVSLLSDSFSCLLWPTISGALLLVALFSMSNLLPSGWPRASLSLQAPPRASLSLQAPPRASLSLQAPLRAPRAGQGGRTSPLSLLHTPTTPCQGALWLVVVLAWSVMVLGLVSSLVRAARTTNRRRSPLALSEVTAYLWERASVLIGRRRKRWTDGHAQRRSYYLEEFESLVDELLFRLNAFSNSLHHTLPPKTYRADSASLPSSLPSPLPSSLPSPLPSSLPSSLPSPLPSSLTSPLPSPQSPPTQASQRSTVNETTHSTMDVKDPLSITARPGPDPLQGWEPLGDGGRSGGELWEVITPHTWGETDWVENPTVFWENQPSHGSASGLAAWSPRGGHQAGVEVTRQAHTVVEVLVHSGERRPQHSQEQ